MKGNRLASTWNGFFFRPVDIRVYTMLRIGIGGVLAIYMMVLGPHWIHWFSDSGVLDRGSAKANIDSNTWSAFHWIPSSSPLLWCVFGVICLQIGLLIAGIQSRFQTVSLFVWFLSMHHRNNLIWEGGDVLLRVVLFLAIFMPLGKTKFLPSGSILTAPVWPLRLLQLQQSALYLSSVGQKLKGDDWVEGTAVYYASRLDDFSGRILSFPIPVDHLWISQGASWITIAVESLLAFGLWIPSMRKASLFVGITFHLLLELSLNLFVFQWLMLLILATHLFTGKPPEKQSL